MDLEKDGERQIPHNFTYMQNLNNKINEQTKQKQSHKYRNQINGYYREVGVVDSEKK